MHTRKLGQTGLDVSVIGLGTMTWGQQNTEAEGHAQMDYALDHGVNFFDTAELYPIPPREKTQGATERIIGSWFKSRGTRAKVILATKAVGRSTMTWFRDNGAPSRITKAQLSEAVDKSLQRLNTDYIDLYQLHWPDRAVPWGSNPTRFKSEEFEGDGAPFAETLAILDGFVKAGTVRHIGISNESAWGTMRFLTESVQRGLPRMQSIQNAYNLLNRTYDTALAEISKHQKISLIAYSPLAQGYLTGKYLDGARPPGSRSELFNRGQRYELPATDDAIRAYIALAREFSLDPTQMAIAFVNQQPFVASNLIGATNMSQLATNIAAGDVTLSPEINARIDDIHQRFGNCSP